MSGAAYIRWVCVVSLLPYGMFSGRSVLFHQRLMISVSYGLVVIFARFFVPACFFLKNFLGRVVARFAAHWAPFFLTLVQPCVNLESPGTGPGKTGGEEMLTTTKSLLRARGACKGRYAWLCGWAPDGDDDPITIEDILYHNGPRDALWALRAVDDDNGLARWFARWCSAQVAYLWQPPMVVLEWLRAGEEAARAAAWEAAGAAAGTAARAAAWTAAGAAAAARAAAWEAAWEAAGAAARTAARAAAGTAARAAAGTAAWAAAREAVWSAIGRKLAWAIQEIRAGRQLPRISIPRSAATAWR